MNIQTQLTFHFLKDVEQHATERKIKKIKPCRIRVNGKWLVTRSGKTLWRRIGDAKSALNLHLENVFGECFKYDAFHVGYKLNFKPGVTKDQIFYSYIEMRNIINSVIEEIKARYVEFVEIDE